MDIDAFLSQVFTELPVLLFLYVLWRLEFKPVIVTWCEDLKIVQSETSQLREAVQKTLEEIRGLKKAYILLARAVGEEAIADHLDQ
jgi:hypothetical protein